MTISILSTSFVVCIVDCVYLVTLLCFYLYLLLYLKRGEAQYYFLLKRGLLLVFTKV